MNSPEVVDILLVEDNSQDAELTIRALKKGNFANNLYLVHDGAQALEFIFRKGPYADIPRHIPIKLILLDLKLPKVDGLEVLNMIKSDKRTRTIPVVILSSSRQDADVISAYRRGANSYVVKPVNFEGFLELVKLVGSYWLSANQTPN
jgi:two-component system response regulator